MNWTGLDRIHFSLNKPLMVIRGSKGFLACGYIDIQVADTFEDACAVVRTVENFQQMLVRRVAKGDISRMGQRLGITEGMTGAQVLEKIR